MGTDNEERNAEVEDDIPSCPFLVESNKKIAKLTKEIRALRDRLSEAENSWYLPFADAAQRRADLVETIEFSSMFSGIGEFGLTNADLARMLSVEPRWIIHMAEKGVVRPSLRGAEGRGSTRRYDLYNDIRKLIVADALQEFGVDTRHMATIVWAVDGSRDFELTSKSRAVSVRVSMAAVSRVWEEAVRKLYGA